MHPILFEAGAFKLYSYGFLIGLGIAIGALYMAKQAHKEVKLGYDKSNNLIIYLLIAGIIGGKLFLIFEEPSRYLGDPSLLFSGSGFVFYGSLLCCFVVLLWFINKHKLPAKTFLDIIGVTICIIHAFGRLGCFMAGCCFGKPHQGFLSVIYTDPKCQAPLNTGLHPVQLYEVTGIVLLGATLFILKRNKRFQGQIFALYLAGYGILRFFTEMLRGDEVRGFLFNSGISHSQFISLFITGTGFYLYWKWRKTRLESIR